MQFCSGSEMLDFKPVNFLGKKPNYGSFGCTNSLLGKIKYHFSLPSFNIFKECDGYVSEKGTSLPKDQWAILLCALIYVVQYIFAESHRMCKGSVIG